MNSNIGSTTMPQLSGGTLSGLGYTSGWENEFSNKNPESFHIGDVESFDFSSYETQKTTIEEDSEANILASDIFNLTASAIYIVNFNIKVKQSIINAVKNSAVYLGKKMFTTAVT